MSKILDNYSNNQIGAIVSFLVVTLWMTTAFGGIGSPGQLSVFPSTLLSLVIVMLYLKKLKPGFIIGMIFGSLEVLALTAYIVIIPDAGVFILVVLGFSIAHLYFASRSIKEL